MSALETHMSPLVNSQFLQSGSPYSKPIRKWMFFFGRPRQFALRRTNQGTRQLITSRVVKRAKVMFSQAFVCPSPGGGRCYTKCNMGPVFQNIYPPPLRLGHSTPPPPPGTWSLHPLPPGTWSLHPPNLGLGHSTPPTWDLVTPPPPT